MIWHWLSKLWPAPTGSHRKTNENRNISTAKSQTNFLNCFNSNRRGASLNSRAENIRGAGSPNNKTTKSPKIKVIEGSNNTHALNTNKIEQENIVSCSKNLSPTNDFDPECHDTSILDCYIPRFVGGVASAPNNTLLVMDRQRSHKRSSFRMRISRRMRSEFTPVPTHESDSDVPREAEGGAKKKEMEAKKDKHKEDQHGGKRETGNDRGSGGDPGRKHDGGQHGSGGKLAPMENFTDLNVELKEDLGFNFRKKRRSFGSESEKRRGERFQRREIEKRVTLEESDGGEADSSSVDSHVCDFSCPLISVGQCPNSQASKRKLKAPRRSSFTSSTSRDAALNTVTSHGRRPKPLASLSIDDLTGEFGDHGAAIKSPGMLSTASMWSTSDLHIAAIAQKPEPDSVSHGGTNSLSNVSGSFSERMHELVRAFSGRTQRAKEKISQPPTPSSDSDYDAKSAISGTDEPQAPRNIRLGSFLPMGSRASDAFSDDNHDHFVGVWHCKFKTPKFLKRLRFPTTIEPHSKTYVTWLFLVALAFMYNAVVIPLRGVFPYQTDGNVRYWLIADYLCDLIYILDIVVFKNRLRFANNGIVETDRRATMRHYMQKWMFKLDIMSLTPLDLFYLIESVGVNPWLRLPRLLKIQTYWEFYERCDQASRSSAHAIRIIKTMAYMLFLIHIETCGYYAMSVHEGIGINEWVYDGKGIAYIRCFYLAAKTATSIGNNPTPSNSKEYVFMTFYWLSGVFVFALLIGQIRDIVEAAGMVKDNYRKKMDSCLWYMQSINLPKEMKDKVREWFLYNWEQQKTIDERSLVVSLPKKLQTDLAINVHFNTLSKVQLFQDCERNLLYDLVLKLKPILYLPGDYICQKGEVGKEMYIVTQGQVEVVGGENNNTVLATLHEGSVFGEISLLAMSGRGNRRTADVRCKGYTNVFTLSKHDFEMAMTEYPDAQAVLKKRAKKLLKANAKMEKKHKKVEAEEIIKTPPETPKLLQTVIQVMDPDSNVVKHLTPSIRRSRKNLNRPHSRSHSHRLSPTTSNVHHLTPPRSHSYRLANKTSCETLLDPGISMNRPVTPEKDGFDTDDENDEPMFDDSSDDVSLSEVLHDAGAISSFEDDDEDDILMTERYPKNEDGRKSSEYTWRETSLSPMKDVNEIDRNNGRNNNDRDSERNTNGNNNGKTNKSKRDITPNLNDSDNQRNDSQGLISRKENGDYNLKGSNSKLYNDNSRGRNEQPNCEKPGNEGRRTNTKDSNGLCNSIKRNDRPLQHDDSMDDYIEKQRWQGKGDHKIIVQSVQENRKIANSPPMPRMEKLAPPPLVMPSCSSASQDSSDNGARQRKLSVVTPPLSPASPRDKIVPPWVIGNNQTAAKRENGMGQTTRCGAMTPTENIPIRPLTPIETVIVKTPRMVDNTHHSLIRGPALTNGLEGCCGSGPLVDIPAENRVTCAVEIHRQKSVNSSTTDIHGHTETML